MVDTWSRKPGHPKGWGFDSSSYRVHNFTQRSVGVFQPFYSLSTKRLRSKRTAGRGGLSPRMPPRPISTPSGAWRFNLAVNQMSLDRAGSKPAAGTACQPWIKAREGPDSWADRCKPRSTSGLVTGFSIQGWGINTPTRYRGKDVERRKAPDDSVIGQGAGERPARSRK